MELDKIYLGDCMDLLKGIPDKSVDLVVTDPPYVLETQGAGFFGKKSDEYSMQCKGKKADTYGGERYVMKEINGMKDGITDTVLDELCRVMKAVNIYLWCSQKQIMQYLDYFVTQRSCNWNLLSWHKINPIPACGNKYVTDTEFCLFFREKGVKVFGDFKSKATHWETPLNMEDKNKYGHPTIKPLSIIKTLVSNSSEVGGVILDPFCGSGTTCVAAAQLGRHYIGMEIDEKYYKTACERVKNEQQQLTLF